MADYASGLQMARASLKERVEVIDELKRQLDGAKREIGEKERMIGRLEERDENKDVVIEGLRRDKLLLEKGKVVLEKDNKGLERDTRILEADLERYKREVERLSRFEHGMYKMREMMGIDVGNH